jgi:hypothetical protein
MISNRLLEPSNRFSGACSRGVPLKGDKYNTSDGLVPQYKAHAAIDVEHRVVFCEHDERIRTRIIGHSTQFACASGRDVGYRQPPEHRGTENVLTAEDRDSKVLEPAAGMVGHVHVQLGLAARAAVSKITPHVGSRSRPYSAAPRVGLPRPDCDTKPPPRSESCNSAYAARPGTEPRGSRARDGHELRSSEVNEGCSLAVQRAG